ncbi:MAG: hypothetical protein JSV88_32405 [Candidatus Aminicenantes bacterium]|nr:MAG: hypothetical protein JSV88_32405 [Candidatus Aminicenantes bacterium]
MNDTKNVSILKIFMVITAVMLFSINSFSLWYANGSGGAYEGGGDNETTSIDQFIVEGAGYFLDSYAYTLRFMREVELSANRELNYPELRQLLNSALFNMEQARSTYMLLKETADNTPYNPVVIEALKNFNYDLFRESNGLNHEIFTDVKSYLIKGQVREIYGKLLSDMENMINLLQTVKKKIDKNLFPPVNTVRQLNQTYSVSLLFGQYTSGVFDSL